MCASVFLVTFFELARRILSLSLTKQSIALSPLPNRLTLARQRNQTHLLSARQCKERSQSLFLMIGISLDLSPCLSSPKLWFDVALERVVSHVANSSAESSRAKVAVDLDASASTLNSSTLSPKLNPPLQCRFLKSSAARLLFVVCACDYFVACSMLKLPTKLKLSRSRLRGEMRKLDPKRRRVGFLGSSTQTIHPLH